MKKLISLLLFVFLFSLPLSAQTPPSDENDDYMQELKEYCSEYEAIELFQTSPTWANPCGLKQDLSEEELTDNKEEEKVAVYDSDLLLSLIDPAAFTSKEEQPTENDDEVTQVVVEGCSFVGSTSTSKKSTLLLALILMPLCLFRTFYKNSKTEI